MASSAGRQLASPRPSRPMASPWSRTRSDVTLRGHSRIARWIPAGECRVQPGRHARGRREPRRHHAVWDAATGNRSPTRSSIRAVLGPTAPAWVRERGDQQAAPQPARASGKVVSASFKATARAWSVSRSPATLRALEARVARAGWDFAPQPPVARGEHRADRAWAHRGITQFGAADESSKTRVVHSKTQASRATRWHCRCT
jgi:hypothetical protein